MKMDLIKRKNVKELRKGAANFTWIEENQFKRRLDITRIHEHQNHLNNDRR